MSQFLKLFKSKMPSISSAGPDGYLGDPGDLGPCGISINGSPGIPGSRGPEGLKGSCGDRMFGAPGPLGLSGVQGCQGPKGVPGPPGPIGLQGTARQVTFYSYLYSPVCVCDRKQPRDQIDSVRGQVLLRQTLNTFRCK